MKKYGVEEGQRYGRLRVFRAGTSVKNALLYSTCICDCGNISTVLNKSLARGETKSCGCYKVDVARRTSIKRMQKHDWGKASGPSRCFVEEDF